MVDQQSSGELFVSLSELADRLEMDRSAVRKYGKREGFTFVRIRTRETRGQATLALPEGEAEALVARREEQGFCVGSQSFQVSEEDSKGWFYIISLVPDLHRGRLKLGFASSVDNRLQQHRTAAPTAQTLEKWRCERSWETAAIASITRSECNQIGPEVFDFDDVDLALERGNQFFSLMPVWRALDEVVT